MKIYLVGGAVRDRLLRLPVTERDWVVVGSTVAQMLAQGYQQIDPEFPVFRHPETREEYALARTETKVGQGYRGFSIDAGEEVTLQQDLLRRDLTINAIAQDEEGSLIDPYQGQKDLGDGYLRHITPAFCEDPVRILRTARFAAKLGHCGFRVAPITQRLMCQMVQDGAMDELQNERIVQEMRKALAYQQPWRFFMLLHACGALATLWPKLAQKMPSKATQGADKLPLALSPLQNACCLTRESTVRFVALALQAAPPLKWLQVLPGRYHGLLGSAMQAWRQLPGLEQVDAQQLYHFLYQHQAWRHSGHYQQLMWVLQVQDQYQTLLRRIQQAQHAAAQVDVAALAAQGLTGTGMGQALAQQRQLAIATVWT